MHNDVYIEPSHEDGNRDAGFGVKVLRAIGRTVCGLKGHHALLHFEPDSMYLECTECGWRSEGISVEVRR